MVRASPLPLLQLLPALWPALSREAALQDMEAHGGPRGTHSESTVQVQIHNFHSYTCTKTDI